MHGLAYIVRNLGYHWRSHLPVALGSIVASATLTGALLVGDSVHASLRDLALERLGGVEHALVSPRFIREATARKVNGPLPSGSLAVTACPALVLPGAATRPDSGTRANRIMTYGIDTGFWRLATSDPGGARPATPSGREVILNRSLADSLGAGPGDDILLHLGRPSTIPVESLLGRPEETQRTIRLTVRTVLPDEGAGGFSLRARRASPGNAWVPLEILQRSLGQQGRVNAILTRTEPVATAPSISPDVTSASAVAGDLDAMLRDRLDLDDLGLRLRVDPDRRVVVLESESFLIPPAIERAALAVGREAGLATFPVLTYLVNSMSLLGGDDAAASDEAGASGAGATHAGRASIPYSTVAALGENAGGGAWPLAASFGAPPRPGEIVINRWAADELGARAGQRLRVTYYRTGPRGRLTESEHTFVLRDILEMGREVVDPGFTPPYHGITDSKSLAEWDPPFPIDFDRVRDPDEAYWEAHGAAPKAFISLSDGRELWTDPDDPLGRSTSIRFSPATDDNRDLDLAGWAGELRRRLRGAIDPAALGIAFRPVRQQALEASTASTDFGMLFVSFSAFLIASAVMLMALLFRLAVERRCGEIGLLRALGLAPARVVRLIVAEGLLVAGAGAVVGLLAAVGHAWLVLRGMEAWWAAAIKTPVLEVHASTATLLIGLVASLGIAAVSMAWPTARLVRAPVRMQLAGSSAIDPMSRRGKDRRRGVRWSAAGAIGVAAVVIILAFVGAMPAAVAFFVGGAALMVAALCMVRNVLHRRQPPVIRRPGAGALIRLGFRSAGRHPGRSLLAASLIASATFIVTATGAFHLDTAADLSDRRGPTGGFALVGEATIALPHDLASPDGREALGMSEAARAVLEQATILSFRLRPGSAVSCRNIYRPITPRIIGAGGALIERGGYRFAATLDIAGDEARGVDEANPWTLLRHDFADGAIPVIGDENAVKWQLHSGLGQDLIITDEAGEEVRLRFVALLAGSALQDELIIPESRFKRLFPSIEGSGFFLIEAPAAVTADLSRLLERDLASFGFDLSRTDERLVGFLAVQNTYLATFQLLGGLGLVLGSLGLAVILLRTVLERRRELALMRALGFSRRALGTLLLAENALLVGAGLVAGALPALLALAPALVARGGPAPWMSIGLTLAGVILFGIGAGALALLVTLRAPPLPALRRE